MSEDSSSQSVQERPLPVWLAACLVLLGTVCLFFFSQTVGGLVIGMYAAMQHWSDAQTQAWITNSVPAQFVYGLIAEGLLIVGVGWGLYWLRWSWASIGLKRPRAKHLLFGLGAAVPYYALYILIVVVVSAIVPSLNVTQKQDVGFSGAHSLFELVLAFAGLVILPALAEEITMRGFLYSGLKRWLPRIVAGLIVSLLFGAAHLAEGGEAGPLWIGAIDTFTLSLVLVFLREKTGNLWAGIVLHAVKNSIAFVSLFIITR